MLLDFSFLQELGMNQYVRIASCWGKLFSKMHVYRCSKCRKRKLTHCSDKIMVEKLPIDSRLFLLVSLTRVIFANFPVLQYILVSSS